MLILLAFFVSAFHGANVLYEWTTMEYDWEYMGESRQDWLAAGLYIPENCAISGLKEYNGVVYVSIPRWKPGVPATLNTVHVSENGIPLLRPFPDLASQSLSNSNGIVYVQSMEIDPSGTMWIVDSGILNLFLAQYYEYKTPRLIQFDIETRKTLFVWDLSSISVPSTSFLNDIVIDVKNRIAYITDAGGEGGLLMVDLKQENAMRRFESPSTHATPSSDGYYKFCEGRFALGPIPSDGIALHPSGNRLYYCPLIGTTLYSLDATIFRNLSRSINDIEASVINHGDKVGMSDGLAMTASGILYFANVNECSLLWWNTSEGTLTRNNQFYLQRKDSVNCDWGDTFGFDNQGNLLVTTNRIEQYVADVMDFTGHSGFNFRILSYFISEKSYMYSK